MICKNCGTEIADKALICYRCGVATTAPLRKPPAGPVGGPGRLIWNLLIVSALALAGLYLGQVQTAETPRAIGWVLLAIAVILLGWTLARRRRPRRR